ncbi:hypothetical protein T069G_04540 [Trichoderma breve]|uniref:SMODS and SLOG-associating 2TM effector domain-containing protein n=1 Tax=Trichoderma breve TaxID=2034170 RepID=A0A9W9E7M9_9HYPO|nr:hypothetical protein T069G_04540 [Trichoderma breve]KAJ4859552.1 hypothetical protein T069G_04540 [Trichoderma breve]
MFRKIVQAARSMDLGDLVPADREEQGYPPNEDPAGQETSSNGKRITIVKTDHEALIPPNDKLLAFRSLTGIDTVPALSSTGHARRAAPNIGLYFRVVEAEQKAAKSYKIFHIIINFCLGAQIIVGASLTAIGAADGSRHAVTGLGAMGTIMAGILTYLKGSGLPDRFKIQENQWRELREHIEQRERELCLIDCTLDAQEEVFIIEDMYNQAKADLEAKGPGIRSRFGGNYSYQSQQKSRSSPIRSIVQKAATRVAQSTDEIATPPPAAVKG